MILVDTGFFLALAQPNDSLYPCARAWVQVITDSLLITDMVLWEVINGLSKPKDRPIAHDIVTQVTSSPKYELALTKPSVFHEAIELHRRREDKEWSLTDCLSFLVMQDRQITRALTHDHHFEQAGFEALLRRDPP